MSKTDDQSGSSPASAASKHLKPWVSPRRKRFWALVLLVLYTLAGFFLLPWWIESTLVGTLRGQTGHEATVERVQANPYTLSVDVEGFALTDPDDGTTWLQFDLLRVNFQLSSLFRWAWSFDELRLDRPEWLLERFESGETRLGRLLAERGQPPQPPEQDTEPFTMPRLLVYDLQVNDGRVRFRDAVPGPPVALEFGPISVAVNELSTLAEREGDKVVRVELPRGATASWDGSVHLAPPEIAGSFRVDNADLSPLLTYLQQTLPLTAFEAKLSVGADYRVSWPIGQAPELALDDLTVTLADVGVGGLEADARFLDIAEAGLRGGALRFPERSLAFAGGHVDGLDLETWLRQGGTLNLLALAGEAGSAAEGAEKGPQGDTEGAEEGPQNDTDGAASDPETAEGDALGEEGDREGSEGDAGQPNAAEPAPDNGPAGADWRLSIDEFTVSGSRVGFEDRRLDPPAAAALTGIAVTVRDVSNEPGTVFPVSGDAQLQAGGTIAYEGEVQALPGFSFDGRVDLTGVPLAAAQPYLEQVARLQVGDGVLETGFDLVLSADGAVTVSGEVAVDSLSVADARDGAALVSWQRMTIDRFEADTAAAGLSLSRVELQQPYGRLVINEDMTTNWTGILVEQPGSEGGEGTPWSVRVARIGVSEGSMDFADLSLPLPFSTEIRQVEGRVTTLDSESVEPGDIELEGKVDEYGLARASGKMDALSPLEHTDVRVQFRNLRMANLSPYSVGFAGREIDEGKLDLDLRYRIDDTRLTASNDIVISDLVLGDKVDHPGAASLPLGLAVALLKDANGVIDIEIPVEGDVDDPQFDIGGVIWQAFTGLITKVVTAPFRLLGGLVGAGDKDLGHFEFLAGRADLTPPEREKVARLKDALQQRPELTIAVPGAYVTEIDTPALKFRSLRETIVGRLGRDGAVAETREAMLDVEVRDALEQLHQERFPDVALESLRETHWHPPADDPEGDPVFDELAYAADLRDRLLAAEEIGTAELEALARQRAETIKTALVEDEALDSDRIELAPVVEGESEEGEWVIVELEADAG